MFQIEIQCALVTQHTAENLEKKRIRIIMKVLDEAKTEFPETAEFIDVVKKIVKKI